MGVGLRTGLDGNSGPPTGIRSPDLPARSESLSRPVMLMLNVLFRRHFQINDNNPVPYAIKIWINNFEETGSALKRASVGRRRRNPYTENVQTVMAAWQFYDNFHKTLKFRSPIRCR